MLHEFLTSERENLIARCLSKVARRSPSVTTDAALSFGIPLFLDQLIRTLSFEETAPKESQAISGSAGGEQHPSEMGESAALHGLELQKHGFTVEQVVHDYGDLCQAIMESAFERAVPVRVEEFRTLNRCLDNAIAGAVTEFSHQNDLLIAGRGVQALNERLGFLAHELRNHIHTATLAVSALKAGNVGVAGATGAILDRSLVGMRDLIDRSLATVRMSAGMPALHKRISVSDLIAELKASGTLEAQTRQRGFSVSSVDPRLAVDADRDMLLSAVGNLLQNAFKFTKHGTQVTLSADAAADRVRIDVADHCGGLPDGAAETIFLSFTQSGADRSGMGLGLSICKRSVEANHGVLSVRDRPGMGCVFRIELPRFSLPLL